MIENKKPSSKKISVNEAVREAVEEFMKLGNKNWFLFRLKKFSIS